jgi:hypothetical protein
VVVADRAGAAAAGSLSDRGKIIMHSQNFMKTVLLPFAIFATSAFAQQAAPAQSFPSAGKAAHELYQAVKHGDTGEIAKILGGGSELASTADPDQDKTERDMFVEKYKEMHRLARETDGSVTLYIGAENWPFPIPLLTDSGSWHFDAETGRKEVLYRRIGDNEERAIATCHAFVAARKSASAPDILPQTLVALTKEAPTAEPVRFHGYYFRVLSQPKGSGRFTLIAYPAEYRSSGVMTFIVTSRDMVYQKDLGMDTAATAGAMSAFRRDGSWVIADK